MPRRAGEEPADLPLHQLSLEFLREMLLDVALTEQFTRCYSKTHKEMVHDRAMSDKYVRRVWLEIKRRKEFYAAEEKRRG